MKSDAGWNQWRTTMDRDEYAKFGKDLDSLALRIEKRVQELKNSGRFPEDFEGAANDIRAHRQRLRDQVADAISSGSKWKIMEAELARDYGSLSDNALSFERRIDEEFARNRR
jgi:hypothetical protein